MTIQLSTIFLRHEMTPKQNFEVYSEHLTTSKSDCGRSEADSEKMRRRPSCDAVALSAP